MCKIIQLFKPQGGLLPIEVITQMFSLTVLEANSLIAAIPLQWKQHLTIVVPDCVQLSNYESFIKSSKVVKRYYMFTMQNKSCISQLCQKWQYDKVDFEVEELSDAFEEIYGITNQAKYRSFQYRFLHRTIMLNEILKKFQLVATEMCTYCNEEKETLFHFFWKCPYAKKVWTWVEDIVKEINQNQEYKFDYVSISICKTTTANFHIANFIVLVAKQAMYAARCMKQHLTKQTLISKIEKIRSYELY